MASQIYCIKHLRSLLSYIAGTDMTLRFSSMPPLVILGAFAVHGVSGNAQLRY